ncbi:MAG: preprotein translocase subunit SecY [bacterium]
MPMLATFANTFKIPELRKRILLTVGLVFASRLISMIPTPGVDWQTLQAELARIRESAGGLGGGLMDWFNVFSGGALNQCAVGFLSIWPYISASIIIQLLTAVIPQLERLAREGESGRLKLAYYTRYLMIGICVFQAFALATALQNPASFGLGNVQIVTHPGLGFNIMTTICMTSASLLVMWLADQITQGGIGNGTSLIIMINITSRLPVAIIEAWTRYFGLGGLSATKSPVELLLLLLFGFAIAMGTVMLTQGIRKVPIHSTRRAAGGGNSYGMQQTYMPLRVNYTGVMPIIFAGPLIQFPAAVLSRIPAEIAWLSWLKWLGGQLVDMTSPIHLVVYALLIMFFCLFLGGHPVQCDADFRQPEARRFLCAGYPPGTRHGGVSGCAHDARDADRRHGLVDRRAGSPVAARRDATSVGDGLVLWRHELADYRRCGTRYVASDGVALADA